MIKIFLLAAAVLAFVCSNAQDIPYKTCNNCWNRDSMGNHRVVVLVNQENNVAKVVIPWRRRDANPESKRIIIQDAKTGQKVLNHIDQNITRELGEIYFEPISGKGLYYIYYLPLKNEGRSNYPRGVYLKPENTVAANWSYQNYSNAKVLSFEAFDELNSFYPMELIATKAETKSLIEKSSNQEFIVFPEDRLNPIKMNTDLPKRWIDAGIQNSFKGTADKGEWYAFQLGLLALKNQPAIEINFSDLKNAAGNIIAAKDLSCINLTGTTYDAKPLKKTVAVEAGKIQAFWCGVDVPKTAAAGTYTGTISIGNKENKTKIQFQLIVSNAVAINAGENEPWKQTRLKWLNSTLAQENKVIAPYTAIKKNGNELSILGRKLVLNNDGLPKQIQTFFNSEMTDLVSTGKNILSSPIHFIYDYANNSELKTATLKYTETKEGKVSWEASSKNNQLSMLVKGSLEFDGMMVYDVTVTALKDLSLHNIGMEIPFTKASSKYMMGLGQKGGKRPASFNWKWEVATKNQDGAWIGDVNAGLQYSLRDENYVRPLNTNFYLQKPLLLPTSWGNQNKGTVSIEEINNTARVKNYSGVREMKKGESLHYNFTLLITPFHTINTDFQWGARFFHAYKPIDTIKSSGATIINIHHANAINPWINYPFIEHKKMKSFIDSAHVAGLKVKIYNTVRELSNHAYETFPLRSLGHEIYSTGKGGGYSWLQEHVSEDYIPAWFVQEIKDAAIVNSGMSRWHNYYVEGMNWLVNNVGIDGIYLDDVAFDRITMKRIKRVLTHDGHPGIIDLHSANQFNKNDGFNNSANLYMEHFPYLNKLWFGEYFDYEKNSPDFFLTEVSGIPFGLMGEMLEGGGNPYRGMVYGMTNRMPWSDGADPRAIWKLWADFGMKGSKMIGYWSENTPATTNLESVIATVYKKEKSALISVASWSEQTEQVELIVDWKKIGINPNKATVTLPAMKGFQNGATLKITNGKIEPVSIEKGKGMIVWIKE